VSLPELRRARRRVIAVVSILEDKDAAGMLRALLGGCDGIVFTSSENPLALPPPPLQSRAGQLGGPPPAVVADPTAAAAQRGERDGDGIVTRKDGERVGHACQNAAHLSNTAGGFFDTDYVRNFCEAHQGGRFNIHGRARLNAVDNDRKVSRFCNSHVNDRKHGRSWRGKPGPGTTPNEGTPSTRRTWPPDVGTG